MFTVTFLLFYCCVCLVPWNLNSWHCGLLSSQSICKFHLFPLQFLSMQCAIKFIWCCNFIYMDTYVVFRSGSAYSCCLLCKWSDESFEFLRYVNHFALSLEKSETFLFCSAVSDGFLFTIWEFGYILKQNQAWKLGGPRGSIPGSIIWGVSIFFFFPSFI